MLEGICLSNPTEEQKRKVETFMCRLYKDKAASSLNTVRIRTFLTCNKPEEMPPSSGSAKFHIMRAISQAFIWENAHVPMLEERAEVLRTSCFTVNEESLIPIMMNSTPVSKKVIEIISCNCGSGCVNRRCHCLKACPKCSVICHTREPTTPCTN